MDRLMRWGKKHSVLLVMLGLLFLQPVAGKAAPTGVPHASPPATSAGSTGVPAGAPSRIPSTVVPPAPSPMPATTVPVASLDKVRFHADADVFRIVLELTDIPAYTLSIEEMPHRIEVELPDIVNRSGSAQYTFRDQYVDRLHLMDLGGGRFKAIIYLKLSVMPKVSVMTSPTRLVFDLLKNYESKNETILAPGLIYKELIKSRSEGPVRAHLLEIDPKAGYSLRPVLSNDSIAGIETLSEMSARSQALAMVNGPYYMRNGEILGLMKIDRTLVSTAEPPRTAFGLLPDGKILFDAPVFEGQVELPDKTQIPIDGVNRSRGESELILYNGYYAYWTLTAGGGREYVVRDGRIVDIHANNTVIPEGAVVLSASGRTAWMMSSLKVGDRIKLTQTLGPTWDQVTHAVGAGPCLVRQGEIYLTTLGEEFGSDVAGGKAPRTAIGTTREGKILLAVIDGRSRSSVGYSLLELAQFMLEQGAVEAMNLDGGGSSEMIVNDRIINTPSDGRERRLGAGIAVVKVNPKK